MWGNKAPGPFKLCIKGTYVKLLKKRSELRFKNAFFVRSMTKSFNHFRGTGDTPYYLLQASLYKGIEIS